MTIINPNSISGITSFTAEADVMNFYRSNGTLGSLQLNGCNFNTTNGISTFNNLVVGGTLTYEDVKNVDSIGIITARGGLNVTANTDTDTLNVSGISTFKDDVQIDVNSKKLKLGTSGQLNLYFNGTNSVIQGTAGDTLLCADSLKLTNSNASHTYVQGTNGGAATLYHNNNAKLATSSSGATVTGALISSYGGINTRLGFKSGGAEGVLETTSNHSLILGVNLSLIHI